MALRQLQLPDPNSHKGQNGKLLIVGGSELFHAASKWSLDIASKFVDMVFYASVPSNNELIQQAKSKFWNGIVIPRGEVENYVAEADCILIGPGMERADAGSASEQDWSQPLTQDEWNTDTQRVVNYLLVKYPDKKFVIDAGALQMVDPRLLTKHCIITPHPAELRRLLAHPTVQIAASESDAALALSRSETTADLHKLLKLLEPLLRNEVTLLLKGKLDWIITKDEQIAVSGGNAGMTKGGTGDVLAGLVAALYCTHPSRVAAVVGSFTNKRAGDELYTSVGPFFSASDLVDEIPRVLWQEYSRLVSQ